jgi:hypothetical protein
MQKKQPLNEGTTRGQVKLCISKPTPTKNVRPSAPPPAPKPRKDK